MLQTVKGTGAIIIDCIDIKVDESIPTKDIHRNNVELNTEDTARNEEEQV